MAGACDGAAGTCRFNRRLCLEFLVILVCALSLTIGSMAVAVQLVPVAAYIPATHHSPRMNNTEIEPAFRFRNNDKDSYWFEVKGLREVVVKSNAESQKNQQKSVGSIGLRGS